MRPHGQRARYMFGPAGGDTRNGCRCIPCTDANTAYQRGRRADLRRLHGPTGRTTTAEEARAHIAFLASRGCGDRAIAEAAGLDRSTVQRIRQGRYAYVYKATAEAILGVSVIRARKPAQLVPVEPTRLLVDEMVAAGWARRDLARMLGYTGRGLPFLRHPRITAANAARVHALHERLVVLEVAASVERTRRWRGRRAA